jgi:hypothetical protein
VEGDLGFNSAPLPEADQKKLRDAKLIDEHEIAMTLSESAVYAVNTTNGAQRVVNVTGLLLESTRKLLKG